MGEVAELGPGLAGSQRLEEALPKIPSRFAVLSKHYQLFLIKVSNANPPFGSRVALTATRGVT